MDVSNISSVIKLNLLTNVKDCNYSCNKWVKQIKLSRMKMTDIEIHALICIETIVVVQLNQSYVEIFMLGSKMAA